MYICPIRTSWMFMWHTYVTIHTTWEMHIYSTYLCGTVASRRHCAERRVDGRVFPRWGRAVVVRHLIRVTPLVASPWSSCTFVLPLTHSSQSVGVFSRRQHIMIYFIWIPKGRYMGLRDGRMVSGGKHVLPAVIQDYWTILFSTVHHIKRTDK